MKFNCEVRAFVITSLVLLISAKHADKPCSARNIRNRSVLCVCTARYCDTVIREIPTIDKSYIYVSSESGLRFKKTTEPVQPMDEDADSDTILELDPMVQFQTIEGFGGAVTDAAGINWKDLNDAKLMDHLIQSYCGNKGIGYNMLRVPIGGTDFSTRAYAYNEMPENDITLSNFTLAQEDYEYKLPMIKACMKAAKAPVEVVTSTWSPPSWMKTNNSTEYLQTYADYHYKFIENYAREGVPIWAATTSTEPLSASVNYVNINNLGWTFDYLNEWIVKNIGPTLRNSTFKNMKLIVEEDHRNTITLYWNMLVTMYPDMLQYLAGVATHSHMDRYSLAPIFKQVVRDFSDKFLMSMVASTGVQETVNVDLGSWERAELYVNNIIESLNNNVVGWIDWNMALNTQGGPSWTGTRADSPIIINAAAREFYKQPMFYAIGHFSKFIPRGSKRIQYIITGRTNTNIQTVAFITPMNTIVVVIYNKAKRDEVRIRLGDQEVEVVLKTKSVTTIEMPNM